MKTYRVLAVLALALVLISGCATAGAMSGSGAPVLDRIQQKGELVVGTAPISPPFSMKTKQGTVMGLEIDMAGAMAQAMGVKLKVEAMEFGQLLPALEAGKLDMVISSLTMTPKRNLKVAFVGPYFISGKGILTSVSRAALKDPNKLNSPETKLAVLKGSTSEQMARKVLNKAAIIPTPDYDTAVKMVISGQAGALFADYPICAISVLKNPGKDLLAVISPLSYEPLGIAIPSGDSLYINWVENYLGMLKGSGIYKKMEEYWMNDPSWFARLP